MGKKSGYYNDYWMDYEFAPPIPVKGGIKARSQHGAFAKSWWGQRWIETLTGLVDSARLSRGRSYARRGQVIDIKIAPGRVTARVQGSRPTPYRVEIELKPLNEEEWDTVLDALAAQAIFAAQLLNGEMPPEVEQVFEQVEVPLFPTSRNDLKTGCTCPDWSNPCKHVAAVYYLLGERFDQDPFLLFQLRGKTQAQVAAALRERRAGSALAEAAAEQEEAAPAPSLDENVERFWKWDAQLDQVALHLAPPEVTIAVLKRLGVPAFLNDRALWREAESVYEGVTEKTLELAYGQ